MSSESVPIYLHLVVVISKVGVSEGVPPRHPYIWYAEVLGVLSRLSRLPLTLFHAMSLAISRAFRSA